MKILGRSSHRIASVFCHLPAYFVALLRCIQLFRKPVKVLYFYVRRKNPPGREVVLRDRLIIRLSDDNSDIVTVFSIFCRRDYGKITPGIYVVDIGANIGVFALYAAWQGAKVVEAYEPAEGSFDILQKNIENNGFGKIIHPHKAAVVGESSPPTVRFPRRSNVFNAIGANSENGSDDCVVPTITLAEIVSNIAESNMFKLDCEGGEYDIILNSEDSVFESIEEIRLEYHQGPHQLLFKRFEKLGFNGRQFMDEGEGAGYLWLTRSV